MLYTELRKRKEILQGGVEYVKYHRLGNRCNSSNIWSDKPFYRVNVRKTCLIYCYIKAIE